MQDAVLPQAAIWVRGTAMQRQRHRHSDLVSAVSFWALASFLAFLWVVGGASVADALGQPLVRAGAWLLVIGAIVVLPAWDWRRVKPVVIILGLIIALTASHLITLPPSIWSALPNREILLLAAEAAGEGQPWRPLSISPGATANALHSLIVPVVTLILISVLHREHNWRLLTLLICLVFAGSLIAILQLIEVRWNNPFINDAPGAVSGNFANRNHYALFCAIGILLLPVWAVRAPAKQWRAIAAFGLVLYFGLILLASGSRMGLLLGVVAFAISMFIARQRLSTMFQGFSRKIALLVGVGVALSGVGILALSISLGRADAVRRLFGNVASDDFRTLALPTILDLTWQYFPAGAGLGTFDVSYRMAEQSELLQRKYLNHAHNDWLEVVLGGGVPALALVVGALVWYLRASWKVWIADRQKHDLPRIASAIIGLIMIASVVDYPLRTPMMMAVLVCAAAWLAMGQTASEVLEKRAASR